MPHIDIKMYPGRSEEMKNDIADGVADFLSEKMSMEKRYFSVSIEEVKKENWKEAVVDNIDPADLYVKSDF